MLCSTTQLLYAMVWHNSHLSQSQRNEKKIKYYSASILTWIFQIKMSLIIMTVRATNKVYFWFNFRWNDTKDPDSMTAEQVHEELTKKAHQQYKDIAVVCNFIILSLLRVQHRKVSECNSFYSIYFDLEFKKSSLITFTTIAWPCAFLTGLQDHG